jgi:hypothetical protein
LVFASAPIIIHLLNRRRFIVVDWAPMQYLKQTLKTNRRRLQLEQWILLAIRTLLVILLFVALGRPFVGAEGFGSWLAGEGRVSRLLILDDSLSMGLQVGDASTFEQAQDAAATLISDLGSQDRLTVLLTSKPDAPLIAHAAPQDTDALAAEIQSLKLSDAASAWQVTLDAADRVLEAATFESRQVTVITDLRRAGWPSTTSPIAKKLADAGVAFNIIDVGVNALGNATLTDLRLDDSVAVAGVPTTLEATIELEGEDLRLSDQATLTVDGQSNPVAMPTLTSGQPARVRFEVTFDEPGQHRVSLQLPDDPLVGDNERHLAVEVRDRISVTLVDGEPAAQARDSETFFLGWALEVGPVRLDVKVISESEWLANPGDPPQVLILANVPSIPAERVEQIEAQVDRGMGLMIFTGDLVDVTAYNEHFYRNSQGLLPTSIAPPKPLTNTQGFRLESHDDSPIGLLSLLPPERLLAPTPRRITPAELAAFNILNEGGDDGNKMGPSRVLARWNDAEGSPMVMDRRFGDGRVILFLTTADRSWGDWATDATYVLAVRQAVLDIAGSLGNSATLLVGQPVVQPVDPGRPPAAASVRRPEATAPDVAAVDRTDPAAPYITYTQTVRHGLYELTWVEPGVGEQQSLHAINTDPAESDLTPLDRRDIEQILSPLEIDISRVGQLENSQADLGRELWRTVLLWVIALVVVESAFATWVGRDH